AGGRSPSARGPSLEGGFGPPAAESIGAGGDPSAGGTPMSEATMALARKGFRAWQEGDFATLEAMFHPDVEWHWFQPPETLRSVEMRNCTSEALSGYRRRWRDRAWTDSCPSVARSSPARSTTPRLLGVIDILVRYTLTPAADSVHVSRDVTLSIPLALKPMQPYVVRQFRREGARTLSALKAFAETLR